MLTLFEARGSQLEAVYLSFGSFGDEAGPVAQVARAHP